MSWDQSEDAGNIPANTTSTTFNFVVEDGSADSDANSYASVDYALTYISANPFASTQWQTLTTTQQQALLIRASGYLDVRFLWNGERVDPDSGLRWPRQGVHDIDGFEIAPDCIPSELADATCEMATYLMNDDWTAPRAEDQYREVRVSDLDIKYDPNYRRMAVPDTVVQMLQPHIGVLNSGRRPMFKKIVRS